jgi:Uma2 family endonuclease
MTATIIEKNTSKSTQKQHYTPEEYQEKAEFKHEYRDGEIVAMTGGTTNHNKLA